MEYGVQVDNKFAFGSEDELGDPSDLLKLSVQEKKTPAQKKAERDEARKAKAKEEAAKKAAAAVAAANKEHRPMGSGERGGRGGARGRGIRGGRGDGPRPPRESGSRPGRQEDDAPAKEGGNESRGRGRGRGAPRGDRPFRGARGGGPRSQPTDELNNAEESQKETSDENAPPTFDGELSGGFRGGRGRGGFVRGARGGSSRGSRQFDRQSGSDRTGVRAQEKKDGHGKGNWGTEQDELAAETEEGKPEEPETPPVTREKTAEELEQEVEDAKLAAQKTLAEYKATLQKDEKKFNTRRAGEGADDSFGRLVPLAKKEIQEDETHEIVIVQGKENKKKFVEVNIRFAEVGREQQHRGGGGADRSRGAARGRGTRGGHFGGRGGNPGSRPRHDAHFKTDLGNVNEFPSLG